MDELKSELPGIASALGRLVVKLGADAIEVSVTNGLNATVTWHKGRKAGAAMVNIATGDVYVRE